jgi:uncharacterized protein
MSIAAAFTPETALLGGVTLGAGAWCPREKKKKARVRDACRRATRRLNPLPAHQKKHKQTAAAGRLALNGRILGISGIAGGLARGAFDVPRVAFTAGLLGAGAVALPALIPGALQALPPAYTTGRALAAGALVGVGSALGGGCTSGHGICGNARLSARSAAFTGVMMAAGAAAAALSGAPAAVGLTGGGGGGGFAVAAYAAPAAGAVGTAARLAAVAVGTLAALALAGRKHRARSAPAVEVVAEAATGGLFALGLGVSGMLRPAKVIGFLSPLGGAGGGWDPSLGLVMAGALAIAAPVFQRVLASLRGGKAAKPACASGFTLPSKTAIDGRLLAGAAVFGAGWGVGGVCPGPALVSAAAGLAGAVAATPYIAWCAAFLAAHALTSAVAK